MIKFLDLQKINLQYAKELKEVVSFARDHKAELTVLTNEWAENWLLS